MSTPKSVRNHPLTRSTDAPRSVRWRLWAAMLALALVPTAAGIYLTTSLLDSGRSRQPSPTMHGKPQWRRPACSRDSRPSSRGCSWRLLMRMPRRFSTASMAPAERAVASRLFSVLQGGDGPAVRGACITRARDGRSTVLAEDAGSDAGSACADGSLQRRAIVAVTDSVTTAPAAADGNQRLLLATPLRSVSGRNSGVISAEIDVAALFDRAPCRQATR